MSIQVMSPTPERPALDFFHVSEMFEVYDRPTALALDHLLNHLHFLTAVISQGVYSTTIHKLLSRFDHYDLRDENNIDEQRVARILEDECVTLLRYLTRICAVNSTAFEGDAKDKSAARLEQQTRLVKEMRDVVPFIDANEGRF